LSSKRIGITSLTFHPGSCDVIGHVTIPHGRGRNGLLPIGDGGPLESSLYL